MFLKSFLFLHKLTENRSLSETGYLKVRIPVILWSSKKVLTDFIGEAPTPTLTDYLESTEIENCPYSPSSPLPTVISFPLKLLPRFFFPTLNPIQAASITISTPPTNGPIHSFAPMSQCTGRDLSGNYSKRRPRISCTGRIPYLKL